MKTIKLLNQETINQSEYVDNMHSDDFYYGFLGLDKALSYSSLKWLLKSPKWFEYKKRNPDPETQALRDGKLVHTEILEPTKYNQFTFVDTSTKSTTKWKLAVEQNGVSKTYTLKEKYMCNRIATAFLQNDACVDFMRGAETEVPALENIDGLAVRGKADIYKAGQYVADVKTTMDGLQDIDLKDGSMVNQFKYTIQKYDYDLQAYLYTQLFNVPDFYWLVVDKTTTDIGVFKASKQTLETGKIKLEAAVALYNAFFVDELIDLSQYYKSATI
jgi:hypothetical protein